MGRRGEDAGRGEARNHLFIHKSQILQWKRNLQTVTLRESKKVRPNIPPEDSLTQDILHHLPTPFALEMNYFAFNNWLIKPQSTLCRCFAPRGKSRHEMSWLEGGHGLSDQCQGTQWP